MEVVDDGDSAEVGEVLAGAEVAGAAALPAADVGQGVLDLDAFAEPGPPGWGDIGVAEAFGLMHQMADRDRYLRLPKSAADLRR